MLRQRGADDVSAVPIVRKQGEGERLRFFGGGLLTMKATAEETGGAFLLFEDLMSQGKTTPLHVHVDEDETLYVLEGEIVVHIAGENHVLGADGIAVAPRGVPHAFLVTSETARVLTLQTPGAPRRSTAARASRQAPTWITPVRSTSPASASRRRGSEG